MSNALRMPFAEWLYLMSVKDVPYQARTLAVYAACFDVTGNDELSKLSGLSERTFDRWKKELATNGWVLVTQRGGGRGHGIDVHPAVEHVPVTFTDLSARNPRKFGTPFEVKRGAGITGVILTDELKTPAEVAPVSQTETPAKVAETPATIAPVSQTPAKVTGVILAPSRAEVSNNIYNNINNLTNNPLSLTEQETAREGECEIAPGLFKNCSTFRHRHFVIDVTALELQVLGKNISREKVIAFAEAQARQWTAEIANGRLASEVVPRAIARALSIGLTKEANFEEAHTHGMHLKTKAYTRPNKPSRY
jgi:hypothetical protein